MKLHAKLLCGLGVLLIISAGCGNIAETKTGSSFISNSTDIGAQLEPTISQNSNSDIEVPGAQEATDIELFEESDATLELVDRVDYIISRDKTITGNAYVGYFELYGLYEETDKQHSLSLFDAGLQTSYDVTREEIVKNFNDSVATESEHLRDMYRGYFEGCFEKNADRAYLTLYGDSHEVMLFLANNNDGTYTRFLGSSAGNYDLMCDCKLIEESYMKPCEPVSSITDSPDVTDNPELDDEFQEEISASSGIEYTNVYSIDFQCSIEAVMSAFEADGYSLSIYKAKRSDIVAQIASKGNKNYLFLSANQPITTVYWSDSKLYPDEIILEYIPPTVPLVEDSTNIDFGNNIVVSLPGEWGAITNDEYGYGHTSSNECSLITTIVPSEVIEQISEVQLSSSSYICANRTIEIGDAKAKVLTIVDVENLHANTFVFISKKVSAEQSFWCRISCDESIADSIIAGFSKE